MGSWLRRRRIIPAYAGSTSGQLALDEWTEDHPRIRGEHCVRVSVPRAVQLDHPRIRGEHCSSMAPRRGMSGSSPHTRGAHKLDWIYSNLKGIIPAYAGSTCRKPSSRQRCGDHPRIRGEHHHHPIPSSRTRGSSPHTRGAPRGRTSIWLGARIIPAYAGSTSTVPIALMATADHPRIRGEHMPWGEGEKQHPGSSPHTRGAP